MGSLSFIKDKSKVSLGELNQLTAKLFGRQPSKHRTSPSSRTSQPSTQPQSRGSRQRIFPNHTPKFHYPIRPHTPRNLQTTPSHPPHHHRQQFHEVPYMGHPRVENREPGDGGCHVMFGPAAPPWTQVDGCGRAVVSIPYLVEMYVEFLDRRFGG